MRNMRGTAGYNNRKWALNGDKYIGLFKTSKWIEIAWRCLICQVQLNSVTTVQKVQRLTDFKFHSNLPSFTTTVLKGDLGTRLLALIHYYSHCCFTSNKSNECRPQNTPRLCLVTFEIDPIYATKYVCSYLYLLKLHSDINGLSDSLADLAQVECRIWWGKHII